MSLRGPVLTLKTRGEAPSLMDGRTGGTGGRSRKVSFKILHNLWVYRLGIYLLIYGIKVVTKILMGFKIWCQVGVWGTQFSKLPYVREFSNIWFLKSLLFWRISVTKRNLWTIFGIFWFSLLKKLFFCFFAGCFICCSLPYTVFVFSLGFQNLFFQKDFKKIFFLRMIL